VRLGVEGDCGIRFVDSTEVTMVINMKVESTTCFCHRKGITELQVRMYITLGVWHVPWEFRVYRSLEVLIVTVEK